MKLHRSWWHLNAMNGVDDLPEGVREALVQTPYDLDERARRLEAICAEAVQAGNDAIAAWAAIERARVAYDAGMYELVTAWCDRTLVLNAPAEVLGAAVVLRASTPGAPVLDRLAIEHAAELLTASGMWEDAMTAHGHLAHDADVRDDLAAARREYARAIGCAASPGISRSRVAAGSGVPPPSGSRA